jgi:hypothetical protein
LKGFRGESKNDVHSELHVVYLLDYLPLT